MPPVCFGEIVEMEQRANPNVGIGQCNRLPYVPGYYIFDSSLAQVSTWDFYSAKRCRPKTLQTTSRLLLSGPRAVWIKLTGRFRLRGWLALG